MRAFGQVFRCIKIRNDDDLSRWLSKMRGAVPCNKEVKFRIPDGDNTWNLSILFLFIPGLSTPNSWRWWLWWRWWRWLRLNGGITPWKGINKEMLEENGKEGAKKQNKQRNEEVLGVCFVWSPLWFETQIFVRGAPKNKTESHRMPCDGEGNLKALWDLSEL